jgi:hypothetical protein
MRDLREAMRHEADAVVQRMRRGPDVAEGAPTQTSAVTVTEREHRAQRLYVATETANPRRVETPADGGPVVEDSWDFNAPITIDPPC